MIEKSTKKSIDHHNDESRIKIEELKYIKHEFNEP